VKVLYRLDGDLIWD